MKSISERKNKNAPKGIRSTTTHCNRMTKRRRKKGVADRGHWLGLRIVFYNLWPQFGSWCRLIYWIYLQSECKARGRWCSCQRYQTGQQSVHALFMLATKCVYVSMFKPLFGVETITLASFQSVCHFAFRFYSNRHPFEYIVYCSSATHGHHQLVWAFDSRCFRSR